MVTLIATLKAKPGKESLLYEECKRMEKLVKENEPNCVLYVPHISAEDAAEVTFLEKYVDQEAFDTHAASPYFQAFAAKFEELLGAPLQLKFLKDLD